MLCCEGLALQSCSRSELMQNENGQPCAGSCPRLRKESLPGIVAARPSRPVSVPSGTRLALRLGDSPHDVLHRERLDWALLHRVPARRTGVVWLRDCRLHALELLHERVTRLRVQIWLLQQMVVACHSRWVRRPFWVVRHVLREGRAEPVL